jgi:hypothetical protein
MRRAGELFGKSELSRVAAYLDLAIAACEEGLFRERYLYFSRAEIASLAGDKKRALDFLSAALHSPSRRLAIDGSLWPRVKS